MAGVLCVLPSEEYPHLSIGVKFTLAVMVMWRIMVPVKKLRKDLLKFACP